ncbi:hypothetical protein Poli38472_013218 [Pythium oligandrum]|uniref:Crinkler effector protein N-terminal domain-containing protein n=1 Tax=Pythium oligandrum TaxID=41045 RepID=A0A8K1C2M8_PYTOL|nr:hypothetical protein Poli38472_013218 [Pythium oligandrum]|eukprot:TMW55327.1 hypothetical protein Poli38472_013218 [Pythium oligandrum]
MFSGPDSSATMPTLWCGEYGKAIVFSVDIALSKTVENLLQAIYKRRRYGANNTFTADDLKLYLAKKNGVWLEESEDLITLLEGSVDTQFERLKTSVKVSRYFGGNLGNEGGSIHLLVELPPQPPPPPLPLAPLPPHITMPTLNPLANHEAYAAESVTLDEWNFDAVHNIPLISKFMAHLGNAQPMSSGG